MKMTEESNKSKEKEEEENEIVWNSIERSETMEHSMKH